MSLVDSQNCKVEFESAPGCCMRPRKKVKKVIQIADTTVADRMRPLNRKALSAGVSFYTGLTISSITGWLGISILSLSIFAGVLGILGLVLAIISMKEITANQYKQRGYGLAKSVVSVFSFLMVFAIMSAMALISLFR